MKSSGLVYVLILNYNSYCMTYKLVSSFKTNASKFKDIDLRFVVVDNDSSNQQCKQKLINILDDNDTIILLDQNNGYAIGNNIGLKYIYKSNGDYVLIMNPDICISEFNVISDLLNCIKEDNVLAAGPRINSVSPYYDRLSVFDYILPFVSVFKRSSRGCLRGTYDVYKLYGCFMMLDLNKFVDIGMFDDKTFLYFEEDIVAEKARNRGYIMRYLGNTSVIHNTSGVVDSEISIRKYYWMYKSCSYYLKKYRRFPFSKILSLNYSLYRFLADNLFAVK
ncbi:glycosyl transferase family 2 [Prosthecochloris aestuarii DSM 271]|uniref:Glycosyl transferase family 2 n=2 Tax=Prosthecochloris aestuarii TaxID=1102 RepID=B4S3Y4_PROA2|nr:glycosyltransferase [Prosthecochloris aestuarii]ACF46776.1 glycosyl transferase family 2 [Prosthecochloris aestuarii DSM 271]